jgi:hypothetical protein
MTEDERRMARMEEMMQPIDNAIQLTDNFNDMLMLGCAMLQRVREIFDDTIGEEGRKKMFGELS